MKKLLLFTAIFFSFCNYAVSQTIQGDQLLTLVGRPVTDALFLQLKQQETFYTNAWNSDLSLYMRVNNDIIQEVEVENGKVKYGSNERYGYYTKALPLKLKWSWSTSDFTDNLGIPTFTSTAMHFNDYLSNGWKVRVFFEGSKPVSISYSRSDASAPAQTPAPQPRTQPSNPPLAPAAGTPLLKMQTTGAVTVNWSVLRQLLVSCSNLKPFTGRDSVDYIGQVYYSTPYKADGFNRTAIKRYKQKNQWYYEAFYKTTADTMEVQDIFLGLYNAFKKTIADNAPNDFILASVARDPLMPKDKKSMNWLAQWTLYTNYKTLPAGLGKVRVAIMLSGLKNVFKNDIMEYTIKVYILDKDVEYDFFTWDKPL